MGETGGAQYRIFRERLVVLDVQVEGRGTGGKGRSGKWGNGLGVSTGFRWCERCH